ncbi:MAG: S-layer protein [Candidatus Diapherotrites archaeon]|nr:S-layer protein [Candidatus Diapherotrites archaeon]
MNEYVILEENAGKKRIPAQVFLSGKNWGIISNKQAWRILELLSGKEMFPREIAKALKISEQKTYYYVNKLRHAGIIQETKQEEIRGAIAKYYSLSQQALVLIPNKKKALAQSGSWLESKENKWSTFFAPFIENGKWNCKLVIGSPDSHGKHKSRARDSIAGIQLGVILGTQLQELGVPEIELDTNIESLKKENKNLIIVGGPVINKLAEELNQFLPIQFIPSGAHWLIQSKISQKIYEGDFVGVIEKIQHPFFKDKEILFIAGKHNIGTNACMKALAENLNEIQKGNKHNSKIQCRAIEGIDENADGKIDRVEVLE